MNTKRLSSLIILSALTLIIGIIESLLPPILPFLPYVRIGFSNIVIVYALFKLGVKEAYLLAVIKSVFTGIFLGNPIIIAYSLPSSLISLTLITLLVKANKNSLCAISAAGAVCHNLCQLGVAAIMVSSALVFSYLPYFVLAGALSGYAVGVIVLLLFKRLPF
jgi:heptaprenyl diphosphate synthase